MDPSSRPLLTSSNFALISAETALSRSWKGARAYWADEITTLEGAFFDGFDIVEDSRDDALHGAGEQNFLGFRNGQVLVSIHTNGVDHFVSSRFYRQQQSRPPLPVLPPAPKMTSTPLSIMELAVVLPHSGSEKVLSNPTSLW